MKTLPHLAVACLLASVPSASAAQIGLFELGLNVNGAISAPSPGNPTPAGVNFAAFDLSTGLGRITFTTSTSGSHYFGLFADHEIDETINTFFNEFGADIGAAVVVGTGDRRQTWEIDEPGFVSGDIFDNFLNGTLDNSNSVPVSSPDDVSLAMAWEFKLLPGETATLRFDLGLTPPNTALYLKQTDPDSAVSLYLSSVLTIDNGSTGLPDGGSTGFMLLGALVGAAAIQHRRIAGART